MAIQFLSSISITGTTSVSSIANDNSSYTGILVWDGGNLKYRTKSQILSDIGATGNTGTVTSVTVQGTTGLSGSGTVTTSGTITLTNSDKGSSQSIYKNIASDSGTATANSNNDTLTIAGGTNVTTARSGDTITINATDTTTNNFVTSLSFNTGTGVLTAARSGLSSLTVDLDGRYLELGGGTMSGNIAMGDNDVTGIDELIFSNGTKLGDDGADNYLRLTYGDSGAGGILVYDGDGTRQGWLYADGNATPSFGLLDGSGSWAVRCLKDSYVELRHDNAVVFQTTSAGITVSGNVVASDGSDTATLLGSGLTLSRSNSYIQSNADNSDTLNIGQSSVRWGHIKVDSATFKVLNGGTERFGIDSSGDATFAGDVNVGSFTDSGTSAVNIRAGGEHDSKLGLFESNLNHGFSLNYDGGLNQFLLKRHDNSAGGTTVLSLSRINNNATFAGDLTVSGGDITLSGTGRIQGVDTVSSGTDAANKTYVDNAISGVPQGTVTKSGTPVNNQLAVWTSSTNIEGEPELTYDGSTLTVGGSGNTTTLLNVKGTNTAGAPATAAAIGIYGYEGRGEGIFYYDSSYSTHEWYSGLPYSGGSTYQIGFHVGSQANYVANGVLRITSSGQVQFNKYGQSTFSGTVTTFPAFTGDGQIVDRTPAQVRSDIGAGTGSGTMSNWIVSSDSGSGTITNGGVMKIAGGTNISTAESSGTVTITNSITNNNQLSNGSGYITASSSNTLTNKGGNISQWTNDSGYITSASIPSVGNGTLTMTTNTGLDGGATFTANQSGNSAFAVTLDLTEITLSAGLDAGATSLSLDLSEFIDMTSGMEAADEFIVLDGGAERRKAAGEIGNSIFSNTAGYITSASLPTVNNAQITIAAGTNLSGTASFTTNQGSNETITINMDTGGVGAGSYGSSSNSTKIDNITVDAYGRVTAVSTGATGQVNTISSGNTNTLTSSGSSTVTLTPVTGTVNSSSSKLATGAQIQTAINSAVTGVLKYDGTWNASTNSPTLSSGSGTVGEYYIVSVAGSTNLDGITDWAVGDWAVFSDQATDAWQKIDNTQVGNVTGSGSNTRLAVWNSASNITSDSGLTFNTSTNLLTIGGQVNWSGGSSAESNSAYDNMITAFSDSGSSTITLTLTQNDGGTLTTSFSNPQGTTTPSNTQTFTNKSGNISQWTNNSGYITSSSVGNGQIDGRTSGNGLSGSMDATANQSGNTTFTVTSNATTAATASTIAYRDSAGDISSRLFRSGYGNESTISGGIVFRVNNTTDNYMRTCSSPSAIRTFIGAASSSVVSGVTSVATGSGLTGGTITSTGTLSHADTSSQGSVNNSGVTYIQDVSLDGFGHVTSLTSSTATLAGLGYTGATNANYITNNNQLTNGAGYTTNTGTTTASNTQTFTNKSGNISQWTNDSGYTTNAGTMTGFGVAAAVGGSSFTISNGETLSLVGGTNITASFNSSNESITFNNDITNNNQLTNGAGYVTSSGGSMSTWVLKEGNGTETSTVSNGETVTFAQGSGIQTELTSTSSGGTLTITNTRTEITNNNQLTNGAGYTTNTGTTTASNSQTFTNKGGNISQWTNNSGYTTNTGTTTASNSQTFTNKGGNISQWTNDSGYLTSAGSMSSWSLTADSGGSETITNGESVDIAGGTNITTSRSGATVTITNGITNNNQLTNGAGYTTAVGDITNVTAGAGLSGGGASGSVSVAVDYLGSDSIIKAAPTASGSPTTGDFILIANDSGNVFETAIGNLPFSNNSGDITAVSAGTGMSGGGTSGSVTLNCTITNNNQLTNGAGYTTNTGDITGVTAGSGLTGGGSSGGVTLNVDYGTGGLINDAPGGSGQPDVDDELLVATSSSGTGATVKYVLGDLPFLQSGTSSFANLTVTNTLNVRGALDLADNDILRFGTGDDVEMFFSGSDMFMDINNGEDFKIRDGNSNNATRFTFDADNGNFTATGNITAFSDERLKDDIETLDGSKVLDMRGVSYTKDGKAGSGVIAQELEKVAPELVMTNEKEDGMKSVAYGNLVGYLIEAVKDQQKQIDELKAQINDISK